MQYSSSIEEKLLLFFTIQKNILPLQDLNKNVPSAKLFVTRQKFVSCELD